MIFGGRRPAFTQVHACRECADPASFHDRSLFPQLKGTRVTHAWTGNVAFTWGCAAAIPVRLAACIMPLGCQRQRRGDDDLSRTPGPRGRIIGGSNSTCGFEQEGISGFPALQWQPELGLLPAVGAYYRFRDGLSRTLRSVLVERIQAVTPVLIQSEPELWHAQVPVSLHRQRSSALERTSQRLAPSMSALALSRPAEDCLLYPLFESEPDIRCPRPISNIRGLRRDLSHWQTFYHNI